MAQLEEFLQEKYVDNFEKLSDDKNKVAELSNLYKEYFYDPRTDGFGNVNYIVDSEGHALYLIQKSELPQEIRDGLVGGDCGLNKTGSERYIDYLSLNDVYGVTSNLKIYYSNPNGELYGIASKDEFDDDTTSRSVLDASNPLARFLKSDGNDLTVADTQSVKNLEINKDSGMTSLKDLYVLGSLENLTLKDITLDNLDGIQNALKLKYVFFNNCNISDFKKLADVKKLQYLYFYNFDDDDLTLLCQGLKDAKYDNLEYFAIVGNDNYICDSSDELSYRRISEKYITDLTPLSTLNELCVKNIKYLSLQANMISGSPLESLKLFKKLYLLRIEGNQIESLKGINNFNELAYLYASYNLLGKNESFDNRSIDDSLYDLSGKTSLFYLSLIGNINLKWVGYLSGCTGIKNLYFGDGSDPTAHCVNMIDGEVASIRKVLKNCGNNKTCPSKYWLSLLDDTDPELDVNLQSTTITDKQFVTLGTYKNIKYLNLKQIKILNSGNSLPISAENEVNNLINNTLKQITNLKYLNLSSISNLSELTFLNGENGEKINLIELAACGTKVTTGKKDISGNYTSLELLENCSNMKYLEVDNSSINLGKIPLTMERVFLGNSSYFNKIRSRFWTDNSTVFDSLNQCTNLTNIGFSGIAFKDGSGNLDLRNFSKLKEFRIDGGSTFNSIKFPSSCTGISLSHFAGMADFGNLEDFSLSYFPDDESSFENVLGNLKETNTIYQFTTGVREIIVGRNDLSKFFDLKNNLNIKHFVFFSSDGSDKLTSLNGISKINGLEELNIPSGVARNLSDVSDLSKFSDSLKIIILPNCSISDIHILSNFSKLTYLDFENNCLAQYIEVLDSSGGKAKWITVTEICNRMRTNAGAGQVTVRLKGNSAITDWNEYTKDTSKWASGSSYGN